MPLSILVSGTGTHTGTEGHLQPLTGERGAGHSKGICPSMDAQQAITILQGRASECFGAVLGSVGDLRRATSGEGETEPKQIGDGTQHSTERHSSPGGWRYY